MNSGIEIKGELREGYSQILSPEALEFLAGLERKFGVPRRELLQKRVERQRRVNSGELLNFLEETREIRESEWKVAPIPSDLQQRRVEITGPVDRKMIINALNSGADMFMADFEDSNSPTWTNLIDGQINLRDAILRQIDFSVPGGKEYKLNDNIATLLVRPRGWHLEENNLLVDGKPMSGSLFDFGLYFFHNVKNLMAKGTAPYFYLPKMESHLEARLWNDAFVYAQNALDIPQGTIRATVLIETIWAGFEMDEILYELKDHSAGLNCGRWDYIFSFIKTFREHENFVLPDRSLITMNKAFLSAYVELLIQTCHRRGIHAMGGMAAQIPIKSDEEANAAAFDKVRQDKLREVQAGHDGTWVAHPGLVAVAMDVFNEHMKDLNQIDVDRKSEEVTAEDLLSIPEGSITEKGVRTNINVGILYLEAWLRGSGCVPLYNLMEDAATAEISRTQIWQWVRHQAKMESGEVISPELIEKMVREECENIKNQVGEDQYNQGKFELAAKLFQEMSTDKECPDFLTLKAYEYLQNV